VPRRAPAPVNVPPPGPAAGWTVYILRCADDTLYTGCTNDLSRRLAAHGKGRVKYTRGRLPVALAYHEPADSHGAALRREAAIKRLSRRQKLRLITTPAPAKPPRRRAGPTDPSAPATPAPAKPPRRRAGPTDTTDPSAPATPAPAKPPRRRAGPSAAGGRPRQPAVSRSR